MSKTDKKEKKEGMVNKLTKWITRKKKDDETEEDISVDSDYQNSFIHLNEE